MANEKPKSKITTKAELEREVKEEQKRKKKYEDAKSRINRTHLCDIADSLKDYLILKARIQKLIAGVKKYYIGTTSDYTQRFCGEPDNHESYISTNSHYNKGYTKKYVLARTIRMPLANKFEEKLIADFPKSANDSPYSVGLVAGKGKYYIYLVVVE
ncbi:MAG: hypothetical protein ACXVDZ_17075 [Bacteroidia bacterium]